MSQTKTGHIAKASANVPKPARDARSGPLGLWPAENACAEKGNAGKIRYRPPEAVNKVVKMVSTPSFSHTSYFSWGIILKRLCDDSELKKKTNCILHHVENDMGGQESMKKDLKRISYRFV
jgi:hypothetical protein